MPELRSHTMDTAAVDGHTAARIEAAEAEAWADMYSAAPEEFAERAGIGARNVAGALVLEWAATGRRYFSRAIGLGVAQPATEEAIDDILRGYDQAGITMFLLQSLPHCRPAAYESWLLDRGLVPFDAQERVVRGGHPLPWPAGERAEHELGVNPERALAVARVGRDGVDEWADFLQRVYQLDTGPWLQVLHERPRWHQYVVREEGRLVGARGMYIARDGTAWLGMDGPVPGVHTDDYEPDAVLCAAMVADGLARGATAFIADIEAPSDTMDTPAYRYFGRLGFTLPYARTHYARL
jgi:hypothetical protein